MAFLRLTGRTMINLHSANAEGAVGNYMGLSKMFVVRRAGGGYEINEEPVISGNMVKHWHAVSFIELLKSWNYGAICASCARHVMYRSTLGLGDEFDYVRACAVEDLHGFLDIETNIRRESLAKFSFFLPIEELRAEYEAITHNRVVIGPKGAIDQQAMMVMKREHASAVYGFLMSMDLAYVGRSLSDPTNRDKLLTANEVKIRREAAVLTISNMLSGCMGSSQARALPVMRVIEAVLAVSKIPIPNLTHGFYRDYAEEAARTLAAIDINAQVKKGDAAVLVVGHRVQQVFAGAQIDIERMDSIVEAVARAARIVGQW